jgi:hypothetical protein
MATRYIQKYPDITAYAGGVRNLPNAAGFVYNTADDRVYVNGDGTLRPLASDRGYGTAYFVDPQNGAAAHSGLSWGEAFADFSSLDSILDHGDTIYFSGVYKGNWEAPYKNDVSLIGVANTPRQATDSGVANGAGATWLSADTPVAADLLTITKQAWLIENIFFNNADTTHADILLLRDAETPEADASHASILGCKFTGTNDGIQQSGGVSFVTIKGCTFFNFAGSGDIAISSVTGAGVGTGLEWDISYNVFHDNVHNIIVPLNCGRIHHNWFVKVGHAVTSTSIINLTSAGHVTVDQNVLGHASVEAPNNTLYIDGTACLWIANQCSNEVRYEKPDEA